MLEYMENISQSEAENIRKTIQDLFRQTCILQTKCDPVTLIQKDNPHYQVCARNQVCFLSISSDLRKTGCRGM